MDIKIEYDKIEKMAPENKKLISAMRRFSQVQQALISAMEGREETIRKEHSVCFDSIRDIVANQDHPLDQHVYYEKLSGICKENGFEEIGFLLDEFSVAWFDMKLKKSGFLGLLADNAEFCKFHL